jgi:hypothetical protein
VTFITDPDFSEKFIIPPLKNNDDRSVARKRYKD